MKTRAVSIVGCLALIVSILAGCQKTPEPQTIARDRFEQVNSWGPNGGAILPTQQIITPAGKQLELPGMRPQAIALSPDGALLATSGKTTELVLIDPASGKERQRVSLPPAKDVFGADDTSSHNIEPDKGAQLSYTGLCFSQDGSRIYLSDVTGSVKVFAVDVDHRVTPVGSIALPPTGLNNRKPDIPAGLAVSADGTRLFVALNVSNRLIELDAANGKQLRTVDVGNAPFDVILTGNKAYVSNWGGRRVVGTSVTGPIGDSARVRVDPVRFIANEGSVSVIDLQAGATTKQIMVGMHASAMALSPDRRFVVVANANSDSVSVIDSSSDTVVETISTKWQATDLFGASPNALAFDSSGKTLFVCNGTQNAVAVVAFDPGKSSLAGLIPVGWFPGAIAYDVKRNSISVANIKGAGSTKHYPPGQAVKYNVHQYFGTVSLVELPDKEELGRLTQTVLENCRRRDSAAALLAARADAAPLPVPQRAGEPSVFKHVVYIIKENRTYDQVLGDMKEGNGDDSLCIFGQQITPNQHKISREFVLLDNTYCSGINSAEGHQWADSAIATDYIERSYAGFLRSYPDGMEDNDVDALAYAPTGFIWDNVLAHGKTLRDYGEFTISDSGWKDVTRRRGPSFTDYYQDFVKGTGQTRIASRPAIESLRHYLATDTVGWNMQIPDVIRANRFINELHDFERAGRMPNLSIICLPNDHTSATKAGYPTPAAHVADNDLALGQIVEAISHSSFWKETCILVIEDDPQAGWDHISAYRTTAYIISPYTKRHTVIHTNYNQPSLLHTIELILGLPPMNALDALATPMGDCFTSTPDLTPYDFVPNLVPLDQLNPIPQAIRDPQQRKFAEISQTLPLDEPDKCPEDLLNRILWQAQKGSKVPYPAKLAGKGESKRDAEDRD